MNIEIANHVIAKTPRLWEYIEQQLGLRLGPHADRIGVVSVRFVATKLSGGAKVIRCRVKVGLRKTVTAESAETDIFAAVDSAVATASRRLALAVDLDDASVDRRKSSSKP
jgi:ribosome-associated translation inhibitor RaiA